MKNENILYLECRGCYFWEHDLIKTVSDVGNYRVGSYDYSIHAKNGKDYILEFGAYDKRETRKTHKRTGKPLKHPKTEIVLTYGLHVDTQFENNEGCWRDLEMEREIHSLLHTYTKANILKTVNKISVKQYDKIVLVSADEIISKIPLVYNIGGYREKNIIDNLVEVKTKQYSKDYWVFTFLDSDNNSFDFEYHSQRITG